MGGNPLTQQVAEQALKKLEAEEVTESGDAHPTYAIYNGKQLVARTGLRRSSKRDILVPHIKKDLRVNAQFILELARCPKKKIDWLKEVGAIPSEDGKHEADQGGKSEP